MKSRWVVSGLLAGVMVLAGSVSAQTIKINEIRIDNSGTDTDEYFELIGTPGASLAGYTYIVIGDPCGAIESVTSLDGWSIQADGFLCLRNSAGTPALTGYDGAVPLTFENTDNLTHMLVTGFSGASGQDLDTNNDGTLDVTPWTAIVDCVGLNKGTTPDCTLNEEYLYCATVVGPDGAFVPGHVYRCRGTLAWAIGAFSPLGQDDTPGSQNPDCASPPPDFTDEARNPCVPVAGQAVAVEAKVRFATGANLHYALNGGAQSVVPMSMTTIPPDTSKFTVTIPGVAGEGDRVDYFVRAYNANPDTTQGFAQGYFAGSVKIGDLRVNDANGNNVYRFYGARVRGRVTVAMGVFSTTDTDYYVQDDTGGINVFQFGQHPEQTLLGDSVTVAGALDQYSGKLEISNAGPCEALDVIVHASGTPPAPLTILTCDLGEAVEGMLVRVYRLDLLTGGDTELQGDTNYDVFNAHSCGRDTVTMRIDIGTDIPGMAIAHPFLDLVGIAGQFTSPPYTTGYQILPRARTDITFLDPTIGVDDRAADGTPFLAGAPNPFERSARIRYRVAADGAASVPVRLAVYDLNGRMVKVLFDGPQSAGEHEVGLDARDLPGSRDGIYFLRLRVGSQFVTRKIALVR